ncbi:Scoloptoxin [Pseudolycoriella hygida]|uniref:Scoloptoxin n=1 Tax=Pseudolycoriella hygida TaxID=35572 RepID=A0A9Q0NEC0_9DIPT|nr:Scoloptoxin [Pseudolycoriella hygida]
MAEFINFLLTLLVALFAAVLAFPGTTAELMLPLKIVDNEPGFASSCVSAKMVPITAELQAELVRTHNYFRNSLALGEEAPYTSATNMLTMTWDDSLATECVKNELTDASLIVNNMVARWVHGEKDNIKFYGGMNFINNYNPPSDIMHEHPISHFTQLIWAKADRVGCAVAKSQGIYPNTNTIFLCCNYNTGNILQTPVYISGPAASQCPNGVNPQYAGLCN